VLVAGGAEAEGIGQVSPSVAPVPSDHMGTRKLTERPVAAVLGLALRWTHHITAVTDAMESDELGEQLVTLSFCPGCSSYSHVSIIAEAP